MNRNQVARLAIGCVALLAVVLLCAAAGGLTLYGINNGWFAASPADSPEEAADVPENSGTEANAPTGASEAVEEEVCPTARELGPWAPSADGVGETFEVTSNETVSAGVHVQLWWPGGSGEEWGEQEISVFIPAGLSIEVQRGAGRGWEYALHCTLDEIQSQMSADHERRETDTKYFGVVDIDDLIETGLVVVRFDRR